MEQPLYDYLRGNWRVKRQIEDRLAKQDNWFSGEAQFVGTEAALNYKEVGELTVGETRLEAAQSYKWHCIQKDAATIYYSDGREFHQIKVEGQTANAEHLCSEDIYRAAYTFHSNDNWQVTWQVSGPRKDYTSVTTYRRGGGDEVHRDRELEWRLR